MKKPILLLDFDGVLHSYSSGWQGVKNIPDPPVPGAMKFIIDAQLHFRVCIYSARSSQWGGKRAMKKWLKKHLENYVLMEDQMLIEPCPFNEDISMSERIAADIMSTIRFPTKKPAKAFLTIDDRCLRFNGKFYDPWELLDFKPWHKGKMGAVE